MNKKIYYKDQVCILNFNQGYVKSSEELLASSTFRNVVENYIESLQASDMMLYTWVCNQQVVRIAKSEITNLLRQLLVFRVEELDHYYLENKGNLTKFIEGLYSYWKSFQRFTINSRGAYPTMATSFVDIDADFNRLVRHTYRTLDEKIKGRKNNVYRQLQAGSNAALLLRDGVQGFVGCYEKLNGVPMIDSIMLRTPLILYPRSNKREKAFVLGTQNPMEEFQPSSDFICYPAKIGTLLAYCYVHRDFIASQIALSNLFELANEAECTRPDIILLFGVEHGEGCTFYHDQAQHLWVGSVTYDQKIEYFGYLKKMLLTLFNCAMMEKGNLPMHGAFVSLRLRSGKSKNIMFVGDSGAGKSETIEALKNLQSKEIVDMEIIFDDMGIIGLHNEVLYGQGSEIGAFIRLDDLDKGSPYKELDRSIFMNPQSTNARVIVPAAPYSLIIQKHPIDLLLYANNYDEKAGLHFFDDLEQAKAVFKEGKRMAKGTTDEVGMTQTYFANPFGPMQRQAICDTLIEKIFTALQERNIPIGEIYTQLGYVGDGLSISAQALLDWVVKDEYHEII